MGAMKALASPLFQTYQISSCRHKRLAAAHIALNQPVHDRTRAQVRNRLLPPARRWAPVGEKGREAQNSRSSAAGYGDTACSCPLSSGPAQCTGQDEKLLEYEGVAGSASASKPGESGVLVGIAHRREPGCFCGPVPAEAPADCPDREPAPAGFPERGPAGSARPGAGRWGRSAL